MKDRNNGWFDKTKLASPPEQYASGFFIINCGAGSLKPLEQFNGERHCIACGAKLSRYNPDDECWPCQDKPSKKKKAR